MEPVVLAAIASPRRREILRLLWDGERNAGAIHDAMPDVTFGAVSLQLKVLLDAGLVESRVEQRYRVYSVRRDALAMLAPLLEQMWNDGLWQLKLAAELEETRRGPRSRTTKDTKSTRTTKGTKSARTTKNTGTTKNTEDTKKTTSTKKVKHREHPLQTNTTKKKTRTP